MKRLEISRLMDEYTDTEFFPEGGSAADADVVKARVLAQAAPAGKRRMPRWKTALIAAALAVVLVVLIGAGFPYIQHRLANGTLSFEKTPKGWQTSFLLDRLMMTLEDGRLYFNQDGGGRVDVTGLVSQDTPYIYDDSDPDTGLVYYVILGGTPECYGYLEWAQTPYPFDGGWSFNFNRDGNPVSIVYRFELNTPTPDGRDNWQSAVGFESTICLDDFRDIPWLVAGVEQLDIPYTVRSEECENVLVPGNY